MKYARYYYIGFIISFTVLISHFCYYYIYRYWFVIDGNPKDLYPTEYFLSWVILIILTALCELFNGKYNNYKNKFDNK